MDLIKDFWALVGAIIGGIFWLARLEGRVNGNSKELARLERQIHDDRAEARANRAEQNEILREMNRDIKILLGRGQQVHWNDRTQPPR
ncbi:hypothetical protein [Paracoccus aminovorans]|uniref:hypothetical protein n=1 Tax=Paracoccus aminovorans TaxID=34004 RepID=UPI002B25FF51|nr:hypothetical protein [Paracoccus aminovorans]